MQRKFFPLWGGVWGGEGVMGEFRLLWVPNWCKFSKCFQLFKGKIIFFLNMLRMCWNVEKWRKKKKKKHPCFDGGGVKSQNMENSMFFIFFFFDPVPKWLLMFNWMYSCGKAIIAACRPSTTQLIILWVRSSTSGRLSSWPGATTAPSPSLAESSASGNSQDPVFYTRYRGFHQYK